MNIVFRTDASVEIGTGHVMRCLTLANALQERKAHCHFICREHAGHLIDLIKSQGFAVTVLPFTAMFESIHKQTDLAHAHWLGSTQEEDARLTIAALSEIGQPVDWLVVDHYGIDATWESLVVPHAKQIFVIDDLADRRHICDVLLDQNLGKTKSDYTNLVGENCVTLLGPKYALLQRQYSELQPNRSPRESVQNILIYFGGSDLRDLTGMATQACLNLGRSNLQLNVVIGSSYAYQPALEQLANKHPNLHLHQNLPSLALLMLEADLAIGAGGSTSWERCAMGLPAIIITIAANQIPIANELHKAKAAVYIGKAEEVSVINMERSVQNWLKRTDTAEWSKRCFAITDGRGVERVLAAMGMKGELRARLANPKDEDLLLEWANDPLVRANSFNSDPISAEEHREWFYRKLRQPDICKIYFVEDLEGLPIGQVRFDWDEEKKGWLIDYSVDATMRGQGLGSQILEKAIQELRKNKQDALIFAEVKEQNRASQQIFTKMNFKETNIHGGGYFYLFRCQ